VRAASFAASTEILGAGISESTLVTAIARLRFAIPLRYCARKSAPSSPHTGHPL
jgi:hypothetical protein